ncbi:MAG: hypothetical protein V1772_07435, partial [Chloroflexota bacterium]
GWLYVATRRGVSFIRPDGETGVALRTRARGLAADADGQVWVASADGLYRLQTDASAQRISDLPTADVAFDAANTPHLLTVAGQLIRLGAAGPEPLADLAARTGAPPRALEVDAQGSVWFATEAGLGRLAPDGALALATAPDSLLSSDVRAVSLGPDGAVWAATAVGLARRRPDGRYTRYTSASTEGGLRAMEMWAVRAEPTGVLWMATSAGVSRREPENADWAYYDLPGVRHLVPDGDGGVWLATRSGLYRVRGEALTPVP